MASNFPINVLYLQLFLMIHESKMSTTYMINSAVRSIYMRNKFKNLKIKKGVGIAIKSKETSGKLRSYLADHANITPAE